jgi:hypothetical protein
VCGSQIRQNQGNGRRCRRPLARRVRSSSALGYAAVTCMSGSKARKDLGRPSGPFCLSMSRFLFE